MRKSSVTVFCVFLMLGIYLFCSPVASAEKLHGLEVESGESGGSYLVTDGKMIISGGEVILSGESNMPVRVTGDAKVVLNGVKINTTQNAAIAVDSGVKAELVLMDENVLIGGGKHAGVEVGYLGRNNMATLMISGEGKLTSVSGEDGGAGIGGSGNGDASAVNGNIVIDGGTIVAEARAKGAGIGGGAGEETLVDNKYTAGEIVINDGVVSATGSDGGAGIGGGNYIGANIIINGGTVKDVRGGNFAAGIGGGSCSKDVSIKIDNGSFDGIYGYESSETEVLGGAVIGSGAKVCEGETNTAIQINGGEIENAVAGWGAAGIGGGAGSFDESDVAVGDSAKITRLYTDGVKMPLEDGASVEGNMLQVVFSESVDTKSESNFEVVKYGDKSEAYKIELPKGYRAFVTTVKTEADYSVRGGSYFAEKSKEGDAKDAVKLSVAKGTLAAHSDLRPVTNEVAKAIDEENGVEDTDGSSVYYWIGGGMAVAAMCLFVVYGKII